MKNLLLTSVFIVLPFLLFSQHNLKVEKVADINSKGDSWPNRFIHFKNKIFFTAIDDSYGRELRCYDETLNQVSLVKDINPFGNGITATALYSINNQLVFIANDGIHGSELWISDGTTNGTQILKDINPGTQWDSVFIDKSYIDIVAHNDTQMYFMANDGVNGYELWHTNGTTTGTYMVKNIDPRAFSKDWFSQIEDEGRNYGVFFQGKLIFNANDSIHGRELWITDGTEAGTYLLKDIYPGHKYSSPIEFHEYKNHLFFAAKDSNGYELWVTDGTNTGTRLFANINTHTTGGISSHPGRFYTYQSMLLFMASWDGQPTSSQVYYLNELTDMPHLVTQAPISNINPYNCIEFNGVFYFQGWTTAYGTEPYFTIDGFQTYEMITDIDTNRLSIFFGGTNSSSPSHYVPFNNKLFFTADGGASKGGRQIWVYDDINDTLQPLIPYDKHGIYHSCGSFYATNSIATTNYLYFSAEYDSTGIELWRAYDSTLVGLHEATLKPDSPYKIYPNPNTNNTFHIASSQSWQKGSIRILSLDGKQLHYQSIPEIAGTVISIQKELPKGMYLIEIVDGKSHSTLRYVKQ